MWIPPRLHHHWALRELLQSRHDVTQPNMSLYRPSALKSRSKPGPAFSSQTFHLSVFYSSSFLSFLSSMNHSNFKKSETLNHATSSLYVSDDCCPSIFRVLSHTATVGHTCILYITYWNKDTSTCTGFGQRHTCRYIPFSLIQT